MEHCTGAEIPLGERRLVKNDLQLGFCDFHGRF